MVTRYAFDAHTAAAIFVVPGVAIRPDTVRLAKSTDETQSMPAYMIFLREAPVRDAAAMQTYSEMNRGAAGDFVSKYGLTPLVVYGATEAVEGAAPDGVIILQFPTVADAKAWYNSDAYQAALPHRQRGADYRAIIVEGL